MWIAGSGGEHAVDAPLAHPQLPRDGLSGHASQGDSGHPVLVGVLIRDKRVHPRNPHSSLGSSSTQPNCGPTADGWVGFEGVFWGLRGLWSYGCVRRAASWWVAQ